MTLEEIVIEIKTCMRQMDTLYGKVVFDEWAIVSLAENKARVLFYRGPRNDDFLQNFARDLGVLRAELLEAKYGEGDFEFSRHGTGTSHEAFLVLGTGFYLICNNTRESMDSIARNPSWLTAQVPFVELSDKVRAHPLRLSADTQFIKKTS